ncbi:glycine betaine ABC transporter substrate-binding protein [Nocardiopsis sp. HNM0947]|uniref:Glycine betaine ABC transporter substrate-binding protein n=1 Tax=Nocardiopsis coralli TaxID=2772213 RepID=A0ABR9P3A0_9ACTN|nr:glycine betaine ABC transporter substrate-binding protein [Nocardiopsis coralli]MBE2998322.1 glycine betaine ABC transporter substrate-binding protein [Nocardiopsis coralli]
MYSRKRMTGPVAAGVAGALMLSACGGDGQDLTGGEDGGGEDTQSIEIALVPWEDGIAVTALWEAVLEEKGYDVEVTEVDIAPAFQGLANGDVDLFLGMSYPLTHEEYWEDYGDDLENLGPWYDNASRVLAVPEYVDEVDSIPDLVDHPELFDNQIVGIDPGAGQTRLMEEEVIPGYGLDEDFELVNSSSAAMQAELAGAIAEEEPIVVTLWHPHPAYAQHDLKDLEDPDTLLGEPDGLNSVGREGFAEEYPAMAEWLGDMHIEDDVFAELQVLTVHEHEDDPVEGAREWLRDNPDFLEDTLGEDAEGLEF